jgi:methyltransferase family protein
VFVECVIALAMRRQGSLGMLHRASGLAMTPFALRPSHQPTILTAARAFIADPIEGLLNVQAKIAEREELRGKRTKGGGFMPWPPCPYEVDDDGERRLHDLIGAPWPCPVAVAFWELWSEMMQAFEREGVALGRGAFGGWGDGEPGLVRAVWCLTRHLRPSQVVETGVARGITSRFALEALARNGRGRLWSIRPSAPTGSGAPQSHRSRRRSGTAAPIWTYVRGSSRRRLPGLLAELGKIDLFIHDSRHSQRNVLFELRHAWSALNAGGVVVVG